MVQLLMFDSETHVWKMRSADVLVSGVWGEEVSDGDSRKEE